MYKNLKILYLLAMVVVFSKSYSSNSEQGSLRNARNNRNNRTLDSFVVGTEVRPIIAPLAVVSQEELVQQMQDFCMVIMLRMNATVGHVVDVSTNVHRDISNQEVRLDNLRLQVVRLEDQMKAQNKQIETMQGIIDALQQAIRQLEYEKAELRNKKLAQDFFGKKPLLARSGAGQGAVGNRLPGQRRGQTSGQGTAQPSPASSCLSIGSDDRQGASTPVE